MSENALFMSEMSENILRTGEVKKLEAMLEQELTNEAKLRDKLETLEAEPKSAPRRWWMI